MPKKPIDRLSQFMSTRNLTVENASDISRVRAHTIVRMRAGNYTTEDSLRRLSETLNMSLDWYCFGIGTATRLTREQSDLLQSYEAASKDIKRAIKLILKPSR